MNTVENLSSEQLEILDIYDRLYKGYDFKHLPTNVLDKCNSTLRKKIYSEFGSLDTFRRVYDLYNEQKSDDVSGDYILELRKQIYKRDSYIKNLKKEKQVLMNQICSQENYYDYIKNNIPEVVYTHRHSNVEREFSLSGTAVLHLTDLHYGEVIEMGSTMYDCAIAEARLNSIMKQFCNIVADYNKAVVFINGDMINGNIHAEFDKTNEMTIIDTVLRLSKLLSEHLIEIYESFEGSLDVVFTVGNHARTIPGDVYYKNKVKENWEYLLGNMVKHNLEGTNINVEVASTPAIVYQIEDLKFAVTHGDCFKSLNNIRIGVAKFQEMNMSTIGPFDHMLVGHFHATKIENVLGGKLFANGCFKECDEYSTAHMFSICPPEQTCLIIDKDEIKNIIILNANKEM